jgi:hypothetical protein
METRSSSTLPSVRQPFGSVFRNEKESRAQRRLQREKRLRGEEFYTQKRKTMEPSRKPAIERPVNVVSTEILVNGPTYSLTVFDRNNILYRRRVTADIHATKLHI